MDGPSKAVKVLAKLGYIMVKECKIIIVITDHLDFFLSQCKNKSLLIGEVCKELMMGEIFVLICPFLPKAPLQSYFSEEQQASLKSVKNVSSQSGRQSHLHNDGDSRSSSFSSSEHKTRTALYLAQLFFNILFRFQNLWYRFKELSGLV